MCKCGKSKSLEDRLIVLTYLGTIFVEKEKKFLPPANDVKMSFLAQSTGGCSKTLSLKNVYTGTIMFIRSIWKTCSTR